MKFRPSVRDNMVTQARRDQPGLVLEEGVESLQQRLKYLNQLRKGRHLCDVKLQVGKTSEIYAHRSVLASASPFFFELFTADDENKSMKEDKILYKLGPGFEKEAVEILVNFVYTGALEVPHDKVKSLYWAANKLKMETVTHSCAEHFIEHLTPETCLDVRTIPGIAANAGLVERIDKYIQNQQDNLIHVSRDALEVPRIHLKIIHTSKDEAAITSRALCILAHEWVKRQLEENEILLNSLKDKKHLLYLNLDNSLHDCADIQSGASNDTEIVQDYKRISRKLSQSNMKVHRKSTANTQPTKPRMMLYHRSISDQNEDMQDADWKMIANSHAAENSHLAIVTLKGAVAILSITQQITPPSPSSSSPQTSRPASVEKVDSYTIIPNMSSPRCASGIGSFNGKLLVCGGYDRGDCLKLVEAYDPDTNHWVSLPEMKKGRGRFDLTVLDGKAYSVGGCDGSKELNTVEYLDELSLKWTKVSPLPLARSNIGVCSLGGKVYCIGGWNGQYGIKQCDVYSPQEDQWRTIASLHVGRYQAGVAAINGLVFAIGGCDSWNCLNTVEAYDPETDSWCAATPMATSRRGCGAAIFNGKIYVMGGSDGTQSLCSTEIFDPVTSTWSTGPSMTSCRANVGATVVGGRLYAVGGFSGKTFLNSIEFLDPTTNEWTNFVPKPTKKQHSHVPSQSNITSENSANIQNNIISLKINGLKQVRESSLNTVQENGSSAPKEPRINGLKQNGKPPIKSTKDNQVIINKNSNIPNGNMNDYSRYHNGSSASTESTTNGASGSPLLVDQTGNVVQVTTDCTNGY